MHRMDFNVEALGPCRKKIAVTIPAERVGEEFDKKYDEINDNVAMPGFRPGRAPRRLLEKRFGTRLVDEVKDELIKTALETLMEEKKLEPLAPPDLDLSDIEVEPGRAFSFEFELITKPEFDTPAYKDLEVSVPAIEVTEEEIEAATDRLRRRSATLETAEKAKVAAGDVLVIDWRAMSGDSVEARDDNVYYPFGKGVVAGFAAASVDEQLEGKAVGAKATATVQVAADDPRESLRGQELELQVTLKEIKRYVLPPVDAAFLAKHDYDDEAELHDEMKKGITRAKTRERESHAEFLLVEQLLDSIEISLPEEFVEKELESWAARTRVKLQMDQVDEDDITKQIGAAREDTKATIEREMQRHFLLDRIAQEEGIEVTEAETAQAIQEIASAYGHPVEQVAASFRARGRLAELQAEILHRKARQVMRQHATLVEGAPEKPAEKKAAKKKAAKKKASKKKAAKKKASK
jgi:trigger factor